MDINGLPPFFFEIFHPGLPRLGPGLDATTNRALDMVLEARRDSGKPDLPGPILDIGCGNGPQTMALARRLGIPVTAVDYYRFYLDELERRAEAQGLADLITIRQADMVELTLNPGPDDRNAYELIWSEGALFVMGFLKGIEACRNLLTPGGMLVVSELAWLRADVPEECREFFEATYPAMQDAPSIIQAAQGMGYKVLGHFAQPDSAWWEPLYTPLGERVAQLAKEHVGNADNMALIESVAQEIDVRREYGDWFSVTFFVMQLA